MNLLKTAACLAFVSIVNIAHADQDSLMTWSAVKTGSESKGLFKALMGQPGFPVWMNKSFTEVPGRTLRIDGASAYVLYACKSHDCYQYRFVAVYFPEKKKMYGAHLRVQEGASEERLTWLGGIPDSADLKAIVYAALSESLSNHPEFQGFTR